MGTGCKVLMIVGLVLVAILAVGIVLSYVYCDKITSSFLDKSVDALQAQVLKDLPEGYNVDDIKATFQDFKDTLKSGALKDKLKADKVKAFATQVHAALSDKKIDKEELDKILQSMKEICGK